MSEFLVNATNQPVEVHLASNVVVMLEPRARVEVVLGEGPHPMLDELVRRMVVNVITTAAGEEQLERGHRQDPHGRPCGADETDRGAPRR